ncbi:MAG: DoxX family protein [Lacunisphaera sp.]|nr:DoxX family protein [Lacunisphaera sp.]
MQKFLRLEFIALSPDLGLLVLRLWLGVSMLWLHGWGKLLALLSGKLSFLDPLGIGETPSFLLTILAEVGCSVLLVLGLYTRLAAAVLAFTMGVAFFIVNSMKLAGNPNGELAWFYFGGYLVLLFAGAGKYSIDKK